MTTGGSDPLSAPINTEAPPAGELLFQSQGSDLIKDQLKSWGPQGINGLEVKGGMPPGFGDPSAQTKLMGMLGGDGAFNDKDSMGGFGGGIKNPATGGKGGDLASLLGGGKDGGAGGPMGMIVKLLEAILAKVEKLETGGQAGGQSMADKGAAAGKMAAMGAMGMPTMGGPTPLLYQGMMGGTMGGNPQLASMGASTGIAGLQQGRMGLANMASMGGMMV